MPIATAVFQKDIAPGLQQSRPQRFGSEEVAFSETNGLNARPLEQVQAEDSNLESESLSIAAVQSNEIALSQERNARYEFEAERAENNVRLALRIERIELEPQSAVKPQESSFIIAFGSMRIDTTA